MGGELEDLVFELESTRVLGFYGENGV